MSACPFKNVSADRAFMALLRTVLTLQQSPHGAWGEAKGVLIGKKGSLGDGSTINQMWHEN
jgi:hypothetical protein